MTEEITAWNDNIVWLRPDGGVSITWCASGTDLEAWRDELLKRGDIPPDHSAVAINAEIPARCEFRNAMIWDGTKIVHDMEKAREMRCNQLRVEREPYFKALDLQYQMSVEINDAKTMETVVSRKQILRDITEDPRLLEAKTLDDLRAVQCPR